MSPPPEAFCLPITVKLVACEIRYGLGALVTAPYEAPNAEGVSGLESATDTLVKYPKCSTQVMGDVHLTISSRKLDSSNHRILVLKGRSGSRCSGTARHIQVSDSCPFVIGPDCPLHTDFDNQ